MLHSRFNLPDWTAQPDPLLEHASTQSAARSTPKFQVASLTRSAQPDQLETRTENKIPLPIHSTGREMAPGDQASETVISAWPINRMSGIERLGTQMADRLLGTAESDILVGHGGDDRLSGDGGNDQLIGGMGRDHMAGGAGYDRFFYRHSREGGDRIVDFSVLSDWFVISASGFNGLRSGGILERDQFCRGEVALDRRDRFIYSPQTGMLSFDADGSGIGQSVEIARLPRTLALAHHHFYLVD